MKANDVKVIAWIVGSAIAALGLTVLDGTPWGQFALMVGPLISGAFGVTGPIPNELDNGAR